MPARVCDGCYAAALSAVSGVAEDPATTCIHQAKGLCADCRLEYETDPGSWREFGRHAQGEANWRALQEEMAAQPAIVPAPANDTDIPF